MTKTDFIVKIHLVISAIVVFSVALLYGFYPNMIFKINPDTIDELNLLKAIMGVYIGFSLLWLVGMCNKNYLKAAIISNIIFMIGLAFGRFLSIITDGLPGTVYVFGTFAELFLGVYGIWVLNYLNKKNG